MIFVSKRKRFFFIAPKSSQKRCRGYIARLLYFHKKKNPPYLFVLLHLPFQFSSPGVLCYALAQKKRKNSSTLMQVFFCGDDFCYTLVERKKRRGLDPGVGDFFRFLFLALRF